MLDLLFVHRGLNCLVAMELLCGRPHKEILCGASGYVAFNERCGFIRTAGVFERHIIRVKGSEETGGARRLSSRSLRRFCHLGLRTI